MESTALSSRVFSLAAERLAEQLERLDDALHLGREGLEFDVGDEREARRRGRSSQPPSSRRRSRGQGATKIAIWFAWWGPRGGTLRLMSSVTSVSAGMLTASSS